jgi:ornithine decarboxylase
MVAGADDIPQARFDTARVAGLIPVLGNDEPVAVFRPDALKRTADTFRRGFPGLVSYAVKANPRSEVLHALAKSGITCFDVASIDEMKAVRAVCPTARLHYHNPVRSRSEVSAAKALGVASWSIDRQTELDKLGDIPRGSEIAVRLSLGRAGGAYDFGSKFGASPQDAIRLLQSVAARGYTPSVTFHPGTQCTDPTAWTDYIAACATVAKSAGVTLTSVNVGGGFPAGGNSQAALAAIFTAIAAAVTRHFPDTPPKLWCEPGRAMVSDAMWVLLKVKARTGDTLYLNDGLYGALGEWRDMPIPGKRCVFDLAGCERRSAEQPFHIFGPTCDSLDRVPGTWNLPTDIAEEDHILIQSAGAYSLALVTGFNGYGTRRIIDLSALPEEAGQCRFAG